MPETGRNVRRAARAWTVTGPALLGAAAVPAVAGATTASVEGGVIRIVDDAGIDDRYRVNSGTAGEEPEGSSATPAPRSSTARRAPTRSPARAARTR